MNKLYDILGPKVNSNLPVPTKLKTISFDWDTGGWNNIVLGVEMMICLAKIFNRALIIPEATKWYLLNGKTHVFDFYDEDTFKSFVPVTTTPRKGNKWNAKGNMVNSKGKLNIEVIRKHENANHWHFPRKTRMLSYFPAAFPNENLYSLISSSLRIKKHFIDKSIDLLNKNNLKIGEYVALHVRRNDFQYKDVKERSREDIVNYVLKDNKEKLPVLIITDVYDQTLINIFKSKGHRVVCWAQKKKDGKMWGGSKEYVNTNSKDSIVIDMMCATPAKKFYGSPMSTFSSRIYHWRGLLSNYNNKVDNNVYYTMPWGEQPYWSQVDKLYWVQK